MSIKIRLLTFWETLRTSFWLVPTLMTAGALVLAWGMLSLDRALGGRVPAGLGWVYGGGPEGARDMLSMIAGSMITVAGVVFSITIAALSLASAQFGPRMLRNFTRDVGNQIVLGTFVATFMYCVLVLRAVYGADQGAQFVPSFSVTLGIGLGVASLGVLIYYIHHISFAIQATDLVAAIGEDLQESIERIYPDYMGYAAPAQEQVQVPDFEHEVVAITSASSGYIQAIDTDAMISLAQQHDLVIKLLDRPGSFVVQGNDLLLIWPPERASQALAEALNEAIVLGEQRTRTQDLEFVVNQLAEIAIRALSHAINDPYTAMAAVDWLSAGLARLAEKDLPSAYRYDQQGRLRIIADMVSFAALVGAAFDQLRSYAKSNVAVVSRMLEALATIASHTHNQHARQVLLQHAQNIQADSCKALSNALDRQVVRERFELVLRALEERDIDPTPLVRRIVSTPRALTQRRRRDKTSFSRR